MNIKVSLVIIVIDDFNNKILDKNQVKVYIEGERFPIRKEGGYFVFTNLKSYNVKVFVEAPNYNSEQIIVDLRDYDIRNPILKVRIMPNKLHNLSSKTTCLEGMIKPFEEIYIYLKDILEFIRLLYDYNENDKYISIYNPNNIDLEEKNLIISDKEKFDFFKIKNLIDLETSKYNIYNSMNHIYKRSDSKICSVYKIKADEKGRFFLAFKEKIKDEAICKIKIKDTIETFKIKQNIINKIDLR